MARWTWDPELATVLMERFRGWTACNCTGDMESLPGFLHPDFLYVSVFGKRYDKAGYLSLAGSLTPGAFYEIHRTSARRNGNIAELDGEYFTHSVTDSGDDLTAHTRFTATWVLEGGDWVCLTHHGTLYEPDPAYVAEMESRIEEIKAETREAAEVAARRPEVLQQRSLQELRRELHMIPEVGLHLPLTQSVILRELSQAGIEQIATGSTLTSVTGVLRGAAPGPAVLLRADMDALPLYEESGEAFSSTNGAMHACGHDLHMAGLIGAARRLAARRNEFAGSVVFAFQPGEESYGGGRIMVEEGVLDAAGERVVASYAFHVWPQITRGEFRTRTGSIMAGMHELRVSLSGRGGHASAPHYSRDTVPVLSEIVLALQSFVSRRIDVQDPVVLSVTQVNAESAAVNVIPARSTLSASVRTLSRDSVALLAEELPRLIAGVAEAHGCIAKVEFTELYPPTVNTPEETESAVALLREEFGEGRVGILEHSLMASEDFAFFLKEDPGAFLLLGARPDDVDPDEASPPHSPHVRFDDGVLDVYVRAMERLALDALPKIS